MLVLPMEIRALPMEIRALPMVKKPTVFYFAVVLPQGIDKKHYDATFFEMIPSEAAMVMGANVGHFRPALLTFMLGSTLRGMRGPALATELDLTARLLAIGPRRTWLISLLAHRIGSLTTQRFVTAADEL